MKYNNRQNKYKKKYKEEKLDIKLDIRTLDIMCSYVLSGNKNIKRSSLINLRTLIDLVNPTNYINDSEMLKRVEFITKGIEAKLDKGLTNNNMILQYILGGSVLQDLSNVDTSFCVELSNSEVEWVNNVVSSTLAHSHIYQYSDKFLDVFTRFKTSDYLSKDNITKEIELLIGEMQNVFRKIKVDNTKDIEFSLRDGKFEEAMIEAHNRVTDPNRVLQTGIIGLNEMLGGGLAFGRSYIFLGVAGGGKSLTLLDIALQIRKVNKNFKPKDLTKTPVIVYLTMENDVIESVERFFSMTTNKKLSKISSAEEAIDMVRKEGLCLSDEYPIDIYMKFVPNRSVDTSYLYSLVEDLEDEGYEVIGIIQDHLKRIKSVESRTEVRFELGDIVNEFKTVAQLKDLFIITNSHINRTGGSNIEEAVKAQKQDLVRFLGRSNIGESNAIIENIDGAFIIAQEKDKNNNLYLGIQKAKMRNGGWEFDVIFVPYVKNSRVKLQEDFFTGVPIHKLTLKELPPEISTIDGNNRYCGTLKEIDRRIINKPIGGEFKEEKDNIKSIINKHNIVPISGTKTNHNKKIKIFKRLSETIDL